MFDKSQIKTEENFVILAMIFLIFLIVGSVTYSIYLFIDLTHLSNAANVHVTKNLSLAAKDAQGKLYTDIDNGIVNWTIYADEQNGFQIKYPDYLAMQKSDGGQRLLTLKKFNVSPRGTDSLGAVIYINSKDVPESMSIKDEMKEMGIDWRNDWKQEDFGGKPGIRTGEIQDSSGVWKDMIVWQFGGKIFTLEMECFQANHLDSIALFNKIISEFKFI